MTTFTHGLVVGFLMIAVVLVALTALVLALIERDRSKVGDDPYRALYAAAARPKVTDDA